MSADLSDYTLCVLAGGLGTRLRESVTDLPKVLAPVNGRPFLDYILRQFAEAGVRECVLCTGYLAQMIEETYGDSFLGMNIRYSREETQLGTGGAIRNALAQISTGKVAVANGDSLFQTALPEGAARFESLAAPALIVLKTVVDAARYGRIELDGGGYIREFCEKDGVHSSGMINAGIYFFLREVIEAIPAGENISLEKQVFTGMSEAGKLAGMLCSGEFIDIGTPESYALAQRILR